MSYRIKAHMSAQDYARFVWDKAITPVKKDVGVYQITGRQTIQWDCPLSGSRHMLQRGNTTTVQVHY